MSNDLAVFCTADDAYIAPSVVALESIRRFHPEFDCFVIGNRKLVSQENIDLLSLRDIAFVHSDQNENFEDTTWPNTCYLSLFGPQILYGMGYEYSLGIDGDVLCVQSLDIESLLPNIEGFAGIENMGPRSGNFRQVDFVRKRWNLSEEILRTHNTNTGVVFWNNKCAFDSRLSERSIQCYQECSGSFVAVDQSLLALVSIIPPVLPWLIIPSRYNYRMHRDDVRREGVFERDIRIYHFTGPKPWEPISLKNQLLRPYLLLHRDKWFAFVDQHGVFNRDLTIRHQRVGLGKKVRYWLDDYKTAMLTKPLVMKLTSAFAGFVRRTKAMVRITKAMLLDR